MFQMTSNDTNGYKWCILEYCGFCGAHLWGLLVWFLANESNKNTLYHQVPNTQYPSILVLPHPLPPVAMDHVELHGALRQKAAIVDGLVPLAAAVRLNLKIPQKHPAHVGSRLPPKHPNCLGLPSSKITWPQNVCIMMLPWNKVWAKNRTYSIDSNPIGNRWTGLFEWYMYHETKYRRERTYYRIHVEENCGNKWFYNTHASAKQISSLWPASRARLSREHVPFRKNRNTWLTQEAWMIS